MEPEGQGTAATCWPWVPLLGKEEGSSQAPGDTLRGEPHWSQGQCCVCQASVNVDVLVV